MRHRTRTDSPNTIYNVTFLRKQVLKVDKQREGRRKPNTYEHAHVTNFQRSSRIRLKVLK